MQIFDFLPSEIGCETPAFEDSFNASEKDIECFNEAMALWESAAYACNHCNIQTVQLRCEQAEKFINDNWSRLCYPDWLAALDRAKI